MANETVDQTSDHPSLFFVSVASKGLSLYVSALESTLAVFLYVLILKGLHCTKIVQASDLRINGSCT